VQCNIRLPEKSTTLTNGSRKAVHPRPLSPPRPCPPARPPRAPRPRSPLPRSTRLPSDAPGAVAVFLNAGGSPVQCPHPPVCHTAHPRRPFAPGAPAGGSRVDDPGPDTWSLRPPTKPFKKMGTYAERVTIINIPVPSHRSKNPENIRCVCCGSGP